MEYENHCISLILQLIENYIKFFVFVLPCPLVTTKLIHHPGRTLGHKTFYCHVEKSNIQIFRSP